MIGFDNGILIAYGMCPACKLMVPKEKLSFIQSTANTPTYFMRCPSTETWEMANCSILHFWIIYLSAIFYSMLIIHSPLNLIIVRDELNVNVNESWIFCCLRSCCLTIWMLSFWRETPKAWEPFSWTDWLTAEEFNYSGNRAWRHPCATYNLLAVWQNVSIFGSRPIGATVEAQLTKVVNWQSSY
jgi:hypothetical protein